MTHRAEQIISGFDTLSPIDQKEVVLALLRKSIDVETPPISDLDLVLAADELFLGLDREEEQNGRT